MGGCVGGERGGRSGMSSVVDRDRQMGNTNKKIVNEGKTDWNFLFEWNPSKTNTIKALKICYLDHSQFLLCGELWFVVPQYKRQLWTFSLRLFDLFSLWRKKKFSSQQLTHFLFIIHYLNPLTCSSVCTPTLRQNSIAPQCGCYERHWQCQSAE